MNTPALTLAAALFQETQPEKSLERVNLADYVKTVGGYSLITICRTVPNIKDPDGRQFGWHRASTVFGVIDSLGATYRGVDNTTGWNGGHWSTGFTRYDFTHLLERGNSLFLVGSRKEFRGHYNEARCLQGGWEETLVGTYAIEVELKRIEGLPPEPA